MRKKASGRNKERRDPSRRGSVFLVEDPEFTEHKSDSGITLEYVHENGKKFKEFTSHSTTLGLPSYSQVSGIDPRTGKRGVAHGFIAIGPNAKGVIAIGQNSDGVIAIGQFAMGRVFAFGQLAIAPLAIGQGVVTFFGIGQAIAAIAGVGQFGVAGYGIFQYGVAVWGGIAQRLFLLT